MSVQTSLRAYAERDVSALLGLSVRQIRSCAREGFVSDKNGLLSFEDLVLLRTVKRLFDAEVSPKRVRKMLRSLREQLPEGRPLSALRLSVEHGEIVARDGAESWEPESGQVVFEFEAAEDPACAIQHSAQRSYERACELEETSPLEARQAYLRAIDLDPCHLDSHLNLGRLLHEARDFRGAERHYRAALESNPEEPTAAYNLGVVLEDIGLRSEAVEAYELAISAEPQYRDAYHNAVRLYEESGDKASAVRLLKKLRESSR